eukprot:365665-Chlamydomonas_euryale.AAC.19
MRVGTSGSSQQEESNLIFNCVLLALLTSIFCQCLASSQFLLPLPDTVSMVPQTGRGIIGRPCKKKPPARKAYMLLSTTMYRGRGAHLQYRGVLNITTWRLTKHYACETPMSSRLHTQAQGRYPDDSCH